MKEILLTQGKVAFVDDADFDWLNQWKWHAIPSRNTYYAQRGKRIDGKYITIIMHRLILGLTYPKIKGDHKDHNGLNNQRSNLRIATQAQNGFNRIKSKNKTSKYKGVSFVDRDNRWRAGFKTNSKAVHIGYYKIEEDAARAYDEVAKKHWGEFANLNFPEELKSSTL